MELIRNHHSKEWQLADSLAPKHALRSGTWRYCHLRNGLWRRHSWTATNESEPYTVAPGRSQSTVSVSEMLIVFPLVMFALACTRLGQIAGGPARADPLGLGMEQILHRHITKKIPPALDTFTALG